MLVGENDSVAGVGLVPVPVRLTTSAGLVALLLTVNEPVLAPVEVGVKVTVTWQVAPAAIVEPQLLDWAKLPATTTPETVAGPLPVLVMLTETCGLVVLTSWLPKARLTGDALSVAVVDPPPPKIC